MSGVDPAPAGTTQARTLLEWGSRVVPVGAPGSRVGDYEILGLLGRGGMGTVYRARQPGLGREVALKLLAGPGLTEEARARFEREARSASRLHHPHIVPIHDLHVGEDLAYYSMDLIEGPSLDRRLSEKGPLGPLEAANLLRRLAEATHYAHLNGIVHRDLKPANVLLSPAGEPAIADFGLARSLDEAGLTASGEILGTPAYMAPEQAAGQPVGPATDVHALGAILYECLAGRAPFRAESVAAVLHQVRELDPDPLPRLVPGLPRDLVTICQKAMRKEPPARYATARDLAEDLARFLEGEPIRARRVGLLERVVLRARRHRTLAATVAASAALLAGLGVYHLVRLQRAKEETDRANRRLEEGNRRLEASLARERARTLTYQAAELHRARFDRAKVAGLLAEALALDPEHAPIHRLLGIVAAEEGRLEEAERRLRHARALDPADEVSIYHLFRTLRRLHRSAGAELEGLLVSIVEAKPDTPTGYLARAEQALAALGDRDDPAVPAAALELADRALRIDWSDPDGHYLRARALRLLRDYGGALESVDRAIATGGDDDRYHFERALALRHLGRFGDALAALERAAAIDPGAPHLEVERALLLDALGRPDEAIARLQERLASGQGGAADHYALSCLLLPRSLSDALAEVRRARELDPASFGHRVAEIYLLLRLERLDEGLERIDALERRWPTSAQVLSARGEYLRRSGRLEEAERTLGVALAIDPGLADALNTRAVVREGLGRIDEALADLDRAVALEPGNAHYRIQRGHVHRRAGRKPEALADYDEALRLEPDHPIALHGRAVHYQVLGRFEEARRDLDRAVELARNPELRFNCLVDRGSVLEDLGDLDRALADVDAGLALVPDDPRALCMRARLHLGRHEPGRAMADLERAIEVAPDHAMAHNSRGILLLQLGRAEEGARELDRAIELDPDDARFRADRARLRHLAGALAAAREDYDAALGIDPRQSEVLEGRGILLVQVGEHDAARTDLDAALELEPARPIARRFRALLAIREARLEDALADLDEAIRLDPDYVDALDDRGRARISAGNVLGALQDFQEALRLAPGVPERLFNVAYAESQFGLHAQAARDFEAYLEERPGDAKAWALVAGVHLSAGDRERALAEYEKAAAIDPELGRELAAAILQLRRQLGK